MVKHSFFDTFGFTGGFVMAVGDSRWFLGDFTVCFKEAPGVYGWRSEGIRWAGDRDGEVQGQGCGVRRRLLGGGPVDGESSLAP